MRFIWLITLLESRHPCHWGHQENGEPDGSVATMLLTHPLRSSAQGRQEHLNRDPLQLIRVSREWIALSGSSTTDKRLKEGLSVPSQGTNSLAEGAVKQEKKRKVPCSRTEKNRRSPDVCKRQSSSRSGNGSRMLLPSRPRESNSFLQSSRKPKS